MFLVTTADERTWDKSEQILFLGEWCKSYSERNRWEALDSITVPYHWDDRQQLYRDYQYLQGFYETILCNLADALNTYHAMNYSLRYWRIILGPWLGYFIQMVFDRWQMVHRAVKNFPVNSTAFLDFNPEVVIPQNMDDFIKLFIDDPWNHWIYKTILQESTDVRCTPVDVDEIGKTRYSIIKRSLSSSQLTIKAILLKLSSLIAIKNRYFFIASSPMKYQCLLELTLRQFPGIWTSPTLPDFHVDWDKRSTLKISPPKNDPFEQFTYSLLPRQLPTAYIEGYKEVVSLAKGVKWPQKPELIITANAYHSDDFFKVWAAEKTESGSKLIISQHGGHYGAGKWSFTEEHEIKISDSYFTWGWEKKSAKSVTPLPAVRLLHTLNMKNDPQGNLLLVTGNLPRYSYLMYSVPVASQCLGYFEDQYRFAENLAPEVQKDLVVRLYPQDYGWEQKNRWLDRLPEITFDELQQQLKHSLQRCRLFVGSYNATTFLETLSANIPTILFWNPKHWELRDSAHEAYKSLHKAGILHHTPESAAHLINRIWNDVNSWWTGKEIQQARKLFCNQYARTEANWKNTWKNKIEKLAHV